MGRSSSFARRKHWFPHGGPTFCRNAAFVSVGLTGSRSGLGPKSWRVMAT
jgi:hypothetical protein